jgi:hypothetical protein
MRMEEAERSEANFPIKGKGIKQESMQKSKPQHSVLGINESNPVKGEMHGELGKIVFSRFKYLNIYFSSGMFNYSVPSSS